MGALDEITQFQYLISSAAKTTLFAGEAATAAFSSPLVTSEARMSIGCGVGPDELRTTHVPFVTC